MRTRNVTRTVKVIETTANYVNTITNEFEKKFVNIPYCYYKEEKDRKKYFDSVAPANCVFVNCVENKRSILVYTLPEKEYLSCAKVKKEIVGDFEKFNDENPGDEVEETTTEE